MLNNLRRLGLCVAALLGAVGLFRLNAQIAHEAGDPASRINRRAGGPAFALFSIAKTEILAIYAPAGLVAYARAHGPFDRDKGNELADSLRKANLERCWYGLDYEDTMSDGSILVRKQIIRPGELESYHPTTMAILDLLARRPPECPLSNFRRAEILVIDDSYMGREPFDAMGELEELRRAGRLSNSRDRGEHVAREGHP